MAGEVVDEFFISTGAEFFDSSYHTALGLAKELELPIHKLRMSGHMSQHVKGAGFRRATFANILLVRLYSLKALWQVAKVMLKLSRRRRDLAATDYAGRLDFDTPGESFADFALRHGGRDVVEQVCDPMCLSVLLAGPDKTGTLFGIKSLWKALGDPFVAFHNPVRGVGAFSSALGEACADFTLLSSPVESVVVENGVARGVMVGDDWHEADAVICATPAPAALRILPSLPADVRDILGKVTYSSTCHVVLGVQGNPLDKGINLMLLPSRSGFRLASVGDATVSAPGVAPEGHGLIHAYYPQHLSDELFPLSDEEITQMCIADIRQVAPRMPLEPLFSRVYRWKEAVCLAPGGTLSAMPRLRSGSVPGSEGLFLAGEYTDIPGVEGSSGAASSLRRTFLITSP